MESLPQQFLIEFILVVADDIPHGLPVLEYFGI